MGPHGISQGRLVPVEFEFGEQGAQVRERARLFLEELPRGLDEAVEVYSFQPLSGDGSHGAGERRLQGGTQEEVIVRRHKLQSGPHERGPHDAPFDHQPCEVFAPEVVEAGPEPDVGRARDLGLEGDQALYGLERGYVFPLQQHLAGEGRPVQFAE